LFTINPDSFFNILSIGAYFESNIRFKNVNFLPRIEFIRSYYLPNGLDSLQFNIGYNAVNISANLSVKDFGIYSLFKYGANSIFEHYLYQTNGTIVKWLFIMPYYKKYFFKKSVLLDVRGNYMANINNNEKTFNINTQLFWYLPHDITIRFQNSIYNRSRIDLQTNIKYTYSNIYFEAGIRKEFNCNQPRLQYHDLKVVFYRDINGDHVKNDNEPGIVNVLTEIKCDFEMKNDPFSNFNDMQFLSDESGSIEYSNIQNGFYVIKYQILDAVAGNFSLEQLSYNFEMDKDKVIYIPYHENNKIIGKIVINRDPLSSLGPLDISNIRVIAEDTKGHSYSALSDKEGNFVLYTPQADHYVVKINNVFYESFDLQQSEFIVKFNGFKQFEITFVFNEKKRKINFSNDVKDEKNEVLDDLQLIKKTTLTGKIRDAVSLEPIDAKIEIIDNRNNKVVSSAVSNKLNGNYSISYVAGENLRIEVKSEGHWDHVENLYIEQVISIQNIAKDIILNKLSDGPKEQTFIIYDKKEQEKFKENFKPGQKIPVNNLNFDEKETRLSPNAYPDLDVLIELLKKNQTIKIEIAGHADDTGNERPDNILSLRRAKSVARYLTEHGIPENRIEVNSYSNTRPLVPSTNDKAKKRNRRVEIIVK
jgi:outer membrane protein OmpA-like peptidoglycan-associated protein